MSLLSLQNVSLRFGGIVALDDVSLETKEGTIFGLIGPNGAGKTTAFNVITRLYRLDSGDVVFDGKSLLRTPPSRVVKLGIARTFLGGFEQAPGCINVLDVDAEGAFVVRAVNHTPYDPAHVSDPRLTTMEQLWQEYLDSRDRNP